MTNDTPDIYLMKREKSRAGCLKSLVFLAVILLVGLAVWGIHAYRARQASEPAADASTSTIPMPLGKPERPIADVPMAPLPANATADAADGAPTVEPPPVVARDDARPAPPPASPVAPPAPPADPAPVPAAQPPAPPANLPDAQAFLEAGDYAAARESALSALAAAPGDPAIERFLSDLAMPLLASPRAMPEKVEYRVAPGNTLGIIADKFICPVDLIRKINGLRGDMIQVGQTLLVFNGREHRLAVEVSKGANSLVVTIDGRFFKRYRVATGRPGEETPEGSYKIVDKIVHPDWNPPGRTVPYGDPENPLGTHWLALSLPHYGIHGTWQPETVGSASSDGCIRLLNDDVEELYTILPRGTPVTIKP